jgi:hypothetical protein
MRAIGSGCKPARTLASLPTMMLCVIRALGSTALSNMRRMLAGPAHLDKAFSKISQVLTKGFFQVQEVFSLKPVKDYVNPASSLSSSQDIKNNKFVKCLK